jgi:hypothetical protein
MVDALHEAGIVICSSQWTLTHDGMTAAEWKLSSYGRRLKEIPVMIVKNGIITGLRINGERI